MLARTSTGAKTIFRAMSSGGTRTSDLGIGHVFTHLPSAKRANGTRPPSEYAATTNGRGCAERAADATTTAMATIERRFLVACSDIVTRLILLFPGLVPICSSVRTERLIRRSQPSKRGFHGGVAVSDAEEEPEPDVSNGKMGSAFLARLKAEA
jgi:hypothetical protein